MPRRVLIYSLLFLMFCALLYAEDIKFPFIGKILADKVNIRSGSNINFPSICKLKKDSEIVVRGEEYGWYKVDLPKDVPLYVAKQFVIEKGTIGETIANNINLRIKPSMDSDVIAKLKKGDIVTIRDSKFDNFYTVEPTPNSCGWVSKNFIKFTSPYAMPKLPEKLGSEKSTNDISAGAVPMSIEIKPNR